MNLLDPSSPVTLLVFLGLTSVLALLGALLSGGRWLGRRRARRIAPTPARLPPPPPRLPRPADPAVRGGLSAQTVLERGVWRPPPREQLLHRQESRRRALAEPPVSAAPPQDELAAARRTLAEAVRRHRDPQPVPFAAPEGAPRGPAASETAPAVPAPPRPSRIGRQRQGLESLITPLSEPSSGPPHDTDKH